eukprot:4383556-Pyramimonas_sp.AAC.1
MAAEMGYALVPPPPAPPAERARAADRAEGQGGIEQPVPVDMDLDVLIGDSDFLASIETQHGVKQEAAVG